MMIVREHDSEEVIKSSHHRNTSREHLERDREKRMEEKEACFVGLAMVHSLIATQWNDCVCHSRSNNHTHKKQANHFVSLAQSTHTHTHTHQEWN